MEKVGFAFTFFKQQNMLTWDFFWIWCSENEWRTRYETQLELNGQLETQISVVRERLESLRGDPAGIQSLSEWETFIILNPF